MPSGSERSKSDQTDSLKAHEDERILRKILNNGKDELDLNLSSKDREKEVAVKGMNSAERIGEEEED